MDTIDSMRTFVRVVAEGSFTKAASRLNKSPQLVSKYVAALESRLGVRLLHRSTRHLSITEAGQAYLDRCRQVLADFDDMESAVGQMTSAARGTLRINAPMSFGVTHLSGAVAAYQAEQPRVDVDLALNDREVDLVGEGFDLAIRIAKLETSSLVARRLAPVRLVVCAAPSYLAEHGAPRAPRDLARHQCLLYSYAADSDAWTFERNGRRERIKVDGRLVANNGDALCRAAAAAAGIVQQPTFIVAQALRAGELVRVLEDYEVPSLNLYAIYAHRQFLSAKTRTFIDFLAAFFGSPPYWDRGIGLRSGD